LADILTQVCVINFSLCQTRTNIILFYLKGAIWPKLCWKRP